MGNFHGFMYSRAMMDHEGLVKLANYRMPFGKYKDRLLLQIPEEYFLWFVNKGLPNGELGRCMSMMLEIKCNGLEYLLKPLIKKDDAPCGKL